MGLTIDQMLFYYADIMQSRIDYMFDIRSAIWAEGEAFNKYLTGIVER